MDNRYKLEQFDSIHEFYETISKRPNNLAMKGDNTSKTGGHYFTGTNSYEEATQLLVGGDHKLAERINNGLKLKLKGLVNSTKQKQEYSVAGYQASVPRYLQGIPTSMVNSKKVASKQKVLHFVKLVNYNSHTSADEIMEQGIKALELVTKAEQLGYRINIDIMICKKCSYTQSVNLLVNVKKSSERINVSKAAFAMAHPSFPRRFGFKWLETYPELFDKHYSKGYGTAETDPISIKQILQLNGKDVSKYYIIPQFVEDVDGLIKEWKLQ